MVLAAALGATPADAAAVKTLKDVEPLIEGRYGPGAAPRAVAVAELLHEGTYGVEEVSMCTLCKQCGTTAGLPTPLQTPVHHGSNHSRSTQTTVLSLYGVQVESLLGGRSLAALYDGNASAQRVLRIVGPEGFKLRDRAAHVYEEAGRVVEFRDVCQVRMHIAALLHAKADERGGRQADRACVGVKQAGRQAGHMPVGDWGMTHMPAPLLMYTTPGPRK